MNGLDVISLRAEALKSLCRALQDTAHATADNETDRQTIERIYSLLYVLEDELDLLEKDIDAAG